MHLTLALLTLVVAETIECKAALEGKSRAIFVYDGINHQGFAGRIMSELKASDNENKSYCHMYCSLKTGFNMSRDFGSPGWRRQKGISSVVIVLLMWQLMSNRLVHRMRMISRS